MTSTPPSPIQGTKEPHPIEYPLSERTIPTPAPNEVLRKIPSKNPGAKELGTLSIVSCWLVFFFNMGKPSKTGVCCIRAPVGGGQNKASGVLWTNFAGCLIMGFLV